MSDATSPASRFPIAAYSPPGPARSPASVLASGRACRRRGWSSGEWRCTRQRGRRARAWPGRARARWQGRSPRSPAPRGRSRRRRATPWRRTWAIQPEPSAATARPPRAPRRAGRRRRRPRRSARRDRGEERLRHPEDHRIGVEDERAEDHLLPDEESPALAQGFECLLLDGPLRRRGRDQEHGGERRDEAHRVDRVRRADAGGRDQQAAQRRPDDRAGVRVDRLERL